MTTKPAKETPTAIYYPASALPDKQPRVDLNHDGIIDVLPRVSHGNTFEHKLPPEKYFGDLGGIKTTSGALIRFLVAPPEVRTLCGSKSVVVATDAHARFYIPKSTLSFVPGQRVTAINNQGRQDEVFVLTGIALKFEEGEIDLNLHADVLPNPKQFGYGTYKGKIIEVPLEHLRWVIGDKNDIIDPDRLLTAEAPRNAMEKILKPLLIDAQKWGRTHDVKDPAQKKATLSHLKDLMMKPLIEDLKLRAGIQMALGKLMGLTPADFPG